MEATRTLLNLFYIPILIVLLSSLVISFDNFEDADSEVTLKDTSSAGGAQIGEGTYHAEEQQDLPATHGVPYSNFPVYLTQLAHIEQSVHRLLLEYEIQLQKRLEMLQRLRVDYESSVVAALNQLDGPQDMDSWLKATVVSAHPILTYRMIRRFSKDFRTFTEHIWQSLENDLWENLEKERGKLRWPSEEDFLVATKSLITLQDTHDFDLNLFSNGVLRDRSVQVGLTAQQCLDIAETALELGEINSATEWFQAAHFKGVNGLDSSVTLDDLTQTWSKTYQAFQKIWPMQIFTSHDVFKEAKTLLRQDFNRRKSNLTTENNLVNFKALCRGEQLLTDAQMLELVCYFENKINLYFLISPLRIEIYSWQPLLYKVHNFVDEKTIADLSTTVVPFLISSVESGKAIGNSYVHMSLPDFESQILAGLTSKIRRLPGLDLFQLNVVPNDKFLASAFANGNYYEPCTQCFQSWNLGSSGRTVSAVHLVLHEPEKGGEFAFPLLGVIVPPSVGSAVIYNELNAFGNDEERAMHGSCPVLIGEKWMVTKLIHEAL